MITVEFDEACELPAMGEPSSVTWQARRLNNTTTGEPIVNGMKRAFGKYRINKEMNLLEREDVYNSIRDVLRKDNTDSERKWVESTLSFRMVIVGRSEDYSYKYAMEGFNGCIESIELIEKSPV
jgi:hypothetical protein